MVDENLIFVSNNNKLNWFYEKYYYSGSNFRYPSFQIALNLLNQNHDNPHIIETGCQRQVEDLGAGMSTSIFGEYIHRYGGTLAVCDINAHSLEVAKSCVSEYKDIEFTCSDSVEFLKNQKGCDLLYLDSWDYPYGQMLDKYGGQADLEKAMTLVGEKFEEDIRAEFKNIIGPCQEHCLSEFKAIEDNLNEDTILLIDDNDFPGGGKPGLLKPYLLEKNWTCLFDSQQTIWIKTI